MKSLNDYLAVVLFVNSAPVPADFSTSGPDLSVPAERRLDNDPCFGRANQQFKIRGVRFKESIPTGEDTPTDKPNLSMTPWCWLVKGGLWEDGFNDKDDAKAWGGRRAVNHFHDPLSAGGGGYTGILDQNIGEAIPFLGLARKGISATEWVMNGHSGGVLGFNVWGYPTIGDGLHRAFTESVRSRREAGLAGALRSMGQMMHLIEDNSVPDHARDLAHPGDGFEEFLLADRLGKTLFAHSDISTWVAFPVRTLLQSGVRGFWDRDVYTTNATATISGVTPGISEFTNANFLAWNHFGDVDFSTVPGEIHAGFQRLPHLGAVGSPAILSFRVDNLVSYPWPQLDERQGFEYPPLQGSLPISSIAEYDVSWASSFSGGNIVSPVNWQHYGVPLMARAHGYAQSVLSLALQPARAEVIPVFTLSGSRLELRLWNLWDSGSPHALAWSVDSVKLVAIRPDEVIVPAGEDVSIDVAAGATVPPGGVLQLTVPVTVGQYNTLAYSSYSALLVTAHIANAEQTPLKFSVPIPNGFPLIRQAGAEDKTSLFEPQAENCCAFCWRCGAKQAYRNPLLQEATGTIEVLPVKKDIFMKPAAPQVEAAAKRDARITAVALLAFPQSTASFSNPMLPASGSGTLLTVEGGNLQRSEDGLWMRPVDATDVPNGPVTFTVVLNPLSFYESTGDAPADGARATGSVYLAVWMSSGAVTLQRLVFWPLGPPITPATAMSSEMACLLQVAPRFGLPEGRTSNCQSMETAPMCAAGEERVRLNSFALADNGLSLARWGASDVPAIIGVLAIGSLRATRFGALDVPAADVQCSAAAVAQMYDEGTGRVVCNQFGGMAYLASENATRPGLCQSIADPLPLPLTAEYKREFIFEGELLRSVFGHTDLPQPPTFTITRQ